MSGSGKLVSKWRLSSKDLENLLTKAQPGPKWGVKYNSVRLRIWRNGEVVTDWSHASAGWRAGTWMVAVASIPVILLAESRGIAAGAPTFCGLITLYGAASAALYLVSPYILDKPIGEDLDAFEKTAGFAMNTVDPEEVGVRLVQLLWVAETVPLLARSEVPILGLFLGLKSGNTRVELRAPLLQALDALSRMKEVGAIQKALKVSLIDAPIKTALDEWRNDVKKRCLRGCYPALWWLRFVGYGGLSITGCIIFGILVAVLSG